MTPATKYHTVRDVWDVTSYGISPSRKLAGADERGYVPGAKPPNPKEIALVRQWLRATARHTKTIRKSKDSYGLRSEIMGWFADRGDQIYVSNGAVIAAALAEGYRAVRTVPDAPNAYFDMAVAKPSKSRLNGV